MSDNASLGSVKVPEKISRWLDGQSISKKRIWFAIGVAVITDLLQLGLGPLGWIFIDEGLDIIAMILISGAIGFHMLLLPSFVIKLIPGPDMLPTWTGCTAAVIMLRKKPPSQPSAPPPIDISTEVTPVPPVLPPRDKA